MKLTKQLLFILSLLVFSIISCGKNEGGTSMFTDNFDRAAMLTDWADLIIIPSYESYLNTLNKLADSKDQFIAETNESNLILLREAYINSYKSWQHVAMFEIGKAEQITLRNYTNIYPTDTTLINQNISTQEYNLTLPSNFDSQGFPAMDYLLYGVAQTDQEILAKLQNTNYQNYIDDIVTRIKSLTEEVYADWTQGYRETFISNSGSSATASVDKMVNDFLFHYERFVRSGKVGIPTGVFSGNPISNSVEAPYSNIYSKALFIEASTAIRDFFNGNSFDGIQQGLSLSAYLNYVKSQNETAEVTNRVLDQWDVVDQKLADISDSFKDQIENDFIKLRLLYDEMQLAVIILKVDMMQALNIQVDYVDADGD